MAYTQVTFKDDANDVTNVVVANRKKTMGKILTSLGLKCLQCGTPAGTRDGVSVLKYDCEFWYNGIAFESKEDLILGGGAVKGSFFHNSLT